ncbi:hypothetical protein P3R38_07055 [Pseudomonas sp. NyZ480]|uniref:hypothetical protein n=1 Tax=Pseudomonas sp. NyZ480 TaxID=3035289 RepID=UPI0024096AC7|nr:hypothetical protein [Pseudomonas sp. NyZ480]WEZ90029.1 hypothetical protein P3R38_07055 [Pseudomonas sp. NyZ480]
MKNAKNATVTGSPSAGAPLLNMWTDLAWVNALWLEVIHDDFLIESLLNPRPPAKGREGSETLLRKFSRVEIIGTGNVFTEVFLYPSREFVMFMKELNNLGAKQILRLTEVSVAEAKLRVSLRMDSSCLRYRAQDESVLSIEWTSGARYAFYDPKDSRVPASLPEGYAEYYDRQKKIDIAILPRGVNAKLQDLYIYMLTSESLRDRHFLFYQQPQAYESLVSEAQQTSASESLDALYALFPQSEFPELAAGRAPADNAWFSHLVTPPGSAELEGGMMTPAGWQSCYKKAPEKPWASATVAVAEPLYKIAPHSLIIHAGGEKERLGFVAAPMPGAVWRVAGDAGGALVKEGNDHFYVSAIRPPGIVYNEQSGETLIPAATRASLARVPARTDVVTAEGGGFSTSVSFVTTFVHPTHFIRFTQRGDALQLNCCYFNLDSDEVAVPPKDTAWHILAGNGEVSAEGVFTPAAVAASAVTVVMAVDTGSLDEWRFAVTIIPSPLLSLRDVLRLQQE